nr:aminoacyl-tRNA synthetase, class 1a, anticodon-binding [Tanacetum cinerariifolium]
PLFRFELYSVFLNYGDFIGQFKLFGTLQAAAGGFSPDPLLQQNGFSDIFNREFNNPVRLPSVAYDRLPDFRYFSLPVSSTSVVQIAAKLYITTDKVDDMEILPEDYGREPIRYKELDDSALLEYEALVQALADDLNQSEQLRSKLGAACTLQPTEKKKQDVKYIYNEAFHICDTLEFINIPDKPNGGSGKSIIKGKDGCLELYYVAFKYAVDA